MFLSQLLTVFTTFIIGLFNPGIHTHYQGRQTSHVLAAVISQTPMIPSSPTPSLYKTRQVLGAIATPPALIDCIGPDGKHLKLSQAACNDFNNAWHHTSQPPVSPYGQATKIGNHTYELQLPPDDRMATPEEIFAALNDFRRKNGIGSVSWNDRLSSYAQSRADLYN